MRGKGWKWGNRRTCWFNFREVDWFAVCALLSWVGFCVLVQAGYTP